MRTFERLRKETLEGCRFRGHKMKLKWKRARLIPFKWDLAEWECSNPDCSAYVQVNCNPAPNEIDIAGNAVALHCPVGLDGSS